MEMLNKNNLNTITMTKKANEAFMKVAPGSLGLGGGHKVPKQYRNAMAQHNAKQMVNNFLDDHNANRPRPTKPKGGKGGCGCGK